MTPFAIAYRKAIKGQVASSAALAMADLIGEFLEGNSKQQAGDREVSRQHGEAIRKLEKKLHTIENKGAE